MIKVKDYLTVKEAAEFVGVSPNTLRSWGKEKGLMMYRSPLNNYRLYKKEELEQFLQNYIQG